MQDLLTLAATATLYSLIALIVIGYPCYVWQRTAPAAVAVLPAPVAVAATPAATVEPPPEVPAAVDAITARPVYADAPATPVKRRRQVSPPVQEVIATQPKKRGRPPKAKAA